MAAPRRLFYYERGVLNAYDDSTYYTIINSGYGVGIAYTETKPDFTPNLSVYCCEAWPGVSPETPCNEILTIPTDCVNEVEITVSIEPDTRGSVIGSLLAGD